MLQISADDPKDYEVLLSWNNKLDIANADMSIMEPEGTKEKFIVCSYKMIGINTYNIFVIDLNGDRLIKYWFESYQLWESPIKGFLLSNYDFLMLSKEGISIIGLGVGKNRILKDKENQKRLMHPLRTFDYLKIEPTNHLLFACQYYEDRQICLQE